MPKPKHGQTSPNQIALDDLAAYIAQTSGELALLAGRAQWPLLTYFLNMARVEAESRLAAQEAEVVSVAPPRSRALRAGRS